jgi:uncharacterized protein YabN with tetrapyrrole methylase and pyrophosphatase domain
MRKTKIVCTIGPASENEETLRGLCEAGMNVARLNFSHSTHEEHQRRIDLIKKVREELDEVEAAIAAGNAEATAEEIGDLLLSVASLSRFTKVDAERALSDAVDKFIHRFSAVEKAATTFGASLADMSVEEREKLWQNVKKINKNC